MTEHRGATPPRGEHESFDELAVGWALHALEPEEETFFAGHLPGCPRCRRTVAETAEVMAAMAGDLPPAAPSEGLRARLQAAVERTEQTAAERAEQPAVPPAGPAAAAEPDRAAPPPHPTRRWPGEDTATGFPGYRPPEPDELPPPPTPWRRVLPHALAAAAVAAILGLGTWNVVLSTDRDAALAAAAEQAEIVQSLLQPGQATIAPLDDDDGRPVATVVAREGRVQVVTHGLRANDTDETTYVVWGVSDSAPVALGTFDVLSPRMDLRTVGSASTGPGGYEGYAISLEPGRQAPSTPTEVVADGQVTS